MHLDAIHVYPIKSCGGVAVAEALLDDRGLVHDRRYMLVDEVDRFVSLRTEPRLTRVHVAIGAATYHVSLGDHAALELPFVLDEGPERAVRIWDDEVDAIEHEAGSAAFSAYLGTRVRLVHQPAHSERPVDPRYALATDRVAFADAYPLLLLARETVEDLSRRVGSPMAMARFRPNLVLAGAEAYAEDRMAELTIGPVSFRGPKACSRCTATTVDPATGLTGRDPLRTLAGYRRENGKVWLGMNLVHDGHGCLRAGDPVRITRWHEAPAFGTRE